MSLPECLFALSLLRSSDSRSYLHLEIEHFQQKCRKVKGLENTVVDKTKSICD